MRRDADELHERMDAVIRLAKAITRTTIAPQHVPEEDYDALHAGTIEAYERLLAAWKEWAESLPSGEKKPRGEQR